MLYRSKYRCPPNIITVISLSDIVYNSANLYDSRTHGVE